MKRRVPLIVSVTIVLLAGSLIAPVLADTPAAKEVRTITTTGTATIKVKPDAVRISFGVLSGLPDVKETREENIKKAREVAKALDDLKLPNLQIKTLQGEMQPVRQNAGFAVGQPNQDLVPTFIGYRVVYAFTVSAKDNDPEKLRTIASQVLDTALKAGANSGGLKSAEDKLDFGLGLFGNQTGGVPTVEYFKEDIAETRRQALSKAAEDALANAKALAGGAKVTIADTIAIWDTPEPPATANPANAGFGSVFGGMGLAGLLGNAPSSPTPQLNAAGELEITVRVTVTCRY